MPRPRTDIRPRIVAAARARFLSDGVDGASLRAIARDAGTNIGMIYYYFPAKDDLFLAVVEEVYGAVMRDLEQALAQEGGFAVRIEALYRRLAHMSAREADTLRLVVREALISSERRERLIERFKRGHIALLAQVVAEGRAEGALTEDVPLPLTVITTAILGVAPQVVLQALGPRAPLGAVLTSGDALVGHQLRVLLGGIGAAKEEREVGPAQPSDEPDSDAAT